MPNYHVANARFCRKLSLQILIGKYISCPRIAADPVSVMGECDGWMGDMAGELQPDEEVLDGHYGFSGFHLSRI